MSQARGFLGIAVDALMRELILRAHIARLEGAVRAAHGYLAMVAARDNYATPPGPHEAQGLARRFVKAHREVAQAMDAILEHEVDGEAAHA